MIDLRLSGLGVLVVLLVGLLFGSALMGLGLRWGGYLDDGGEETVVDSLSVELKQEDLQASTPSRRTIRDTITETTEVCTSIPSFLVEQRDTIAVRDTMTAALSDTSADGGGTVRPPRQTAERAPISVNAYWLPLTDGDPAISVTPDRTTAQVYNPNTSRGEVLRYEHPEYLLHLRPTGTLGGGPRGLTAQAGGEANFNLDPVLVRLSGGLQPTPERPLGRYVRVTVSPFTWSLFTR